MTSQAEDLPFAHRVLLFLPFTEFYSCSPCCLPSLSHTYLLLSWWFAISRTNLLDSFLAVASVVSIQMLLYTDASPECPPEQCPSSTSSEPQGWHTIVVYKVTHGLFQSSPIRVLALQTQEFCLIYSYIPSAISVLNECCNYSFYSLQLFILFFFPPHRFLDFQRYCNFLRGD